MGALSSSWILPSFSRAPNAGCSTPSRTKRVKLRDQDTCDRRLGPGAQTAGSRSFQRTRLRSFFARDGREGLDQLSVIKPDVVTLDIHMPHMDGLACLD